MPNLLSVRAHRTRTSRIHRKIRLRPRIDGLEERLLMASPDNSPVVAFTVVNDWKTGFQGGIDFVSSQNEAIKDWTLEFDLDRNIDSIWNAGIISHVNNHYVIKNGGWNASLAAGAHGSFGFTASPGNVGAGKPSNYVLKWGSTTTTPPSTPTTPSLSISDARVTEGNAGTVVAAFTLTLSSAPTSPVSVTFATADGTAKAGSDYASNNGTVTFAAGETTKTIAVGVFGDTVQEGDESFLLNLSAVSGATLARNQATGTIVNDDGVPPAKTFAYGEALQKALFFYQAARSGDLPSNYPVDWRGDSGMTDGADVGKDLTGGYYDAGDHVKFGLPMAYSMSMLAWGAVQFKDAYAKSGQLTTILDAIKWGADFIVKAHTGPNEFYGQVGQGSADHAVWAAPELMTMVRPSYKIDAAHPGSDLAAEAAAALASTAMAFRSVDPTYAATLIQHAEQLFSFADTYRGKYSDSIADAAGYYNSGGYDDELVWGATWLYRATGKQAYLDKAEAIYAPKFAGQTMTWTQNWDDVRYGSAVLLAQLTGKATYKADVERWLDYWTVGLNGGVNRIAYTPGGLAFLNGWGSLRYSAATSMLAFIYSDTVNDYAGRYHDFAAKQIRYILGENPQNFSYMVGFGTNSPKNEHHRGASGVWDGNVANASPNRHILYGALVGGPESADDANYKDIRTDYVGNEVALDYNAGFTGALARMYQEYGGEPLKTFPIPDARDPEYFVQAEINNQGTTFTEIDALLNNRSAWPARESTGLSFRYFVNLSETYAAGYTANDIVLQSYYSQGATIGPLLPWDAANKIYYVDVSFQGVPIRPGAGTFTKQAQLRIGLKAGVPASAWNPANDWSYQGLVQGPNRKILSTAIPVYESGKGLIFGQTPGAASTTTPTITMDDLSIVEGNSGTRLATFSVRLSQPSASSITVNYGTADGTAKAGSDYNSASGTLTFAPGSTSQTFTVPIVGDALVEGNETFRVLLSNATNANLASTSATATIVDDDGTPPSTSSTVKLNVRDSWSTGLVADVTIANNTSGTINGWILEFDLAADITQVWNAEIVKKVGSRYTIKAAAWNGSIAAGSSVAFGFQAAATATPTALGNVVLNGKPV